MRRSIFLVVLFLVVVACSCSRRSKNEAVSVMTLNLRYDNPRDSINAWPNRAAMVCSFINEEKPDLLGMQEVLYRQYEVLDSALTDYASVGVGRSDGARGGEMNPVFYRKDRFDMARTKTFWLSGTPEIPGSQDWGANLPRIVTWMELVDKNTQKHIFFFNTHFAHDSDSARIMSSFLLLSKVDSIAGEFPFIITGDFNQLPSSKGYSILTGPAESVPLLKDAYGISEKKPSGPGYTFNGFSDKQGSGRIDYIFVKTGMKVLDHRVIVKKTGNVFISDHWPVEAVISMK
ncbi:MAG: endonuclease/exonuclease/phosphatase family protein [Bacteroidales bacterium]|jgi:endonuclease/exonuclease/phosphatase family metal-dependent hydrolase|nr:endonuclease/exonuclease/phosphatase family protein [Bacteroidales bacterium]